MRSPRVSWVDGGGRFSTFVGLLGLALLVLAIAQAAAAHPRFPAATAIEFGGRESSTIVVRTTFGLMVTKNAGTDWSFVCGSLTGTLPTEDPAVLLVDDGSLLLGNFTGMFRSDSSLCQYAPVTPAFADQYVIDISQAQGRMVAVTSTGGQENGVHVSSDLGESWLPAGDGVQLLFETVALAPNDPSRVYATATITPSPAEPGSVLLLRSFDDGQRWESVPFEGDASGATLDLLAVDADDPNVLYARLSKDHEILLRSLDAGTSFESLLVVAGRIGGFDSSEGGRRLLVGGPDIGLLESRDGGATFDVRQFDPDVGCLARRGDELWVCDHRPDAPFQVGRSSDEGASFDSVLVFQDAGGPVRCADQSVESACSEEWRDLQGDFAEAFGTAAESGGGRIRGGCSLTSGFGPSVLWLVLAVLAVMRFRRLRGVWLALLFVLTTVACVPSERSKTSAPQLEAEIDLEVVGRLNPAPGSSWAGIWGYAYQGREYALLSGEVGLVVIDITDPAAPEEVERIQMPGGNVHRDVATHDRYAYVGGQQGADLFVIDLTNLPSGARTVGQFREYRNAAHTLHVDAGLLFLNDSGGNCRILSLADPTDPEPIANYRSGECHDSHLHGDLFIAAQGSDGRYDLVDLSDPTSPERIGRTDSANIYAHSVAVPEDGNTMYAFEEANTRDLLIYDIKNRSSPELIGEFEMPGGAIIHNGWIRGDLLFVAYYEEGLVVLDISERGEPKVAAQYDTLDRNGAYLGGWNVYVDLPSKLVLMSDTQSGLWIFRVNGEPVRPPPDAGAPDAGIVAPPTDAGGELPADGSAARVDGGGPGIPATGAFIRGDVNADGVVDREDAISLLREVVLQQPNVRCQSAADIDDDGDVDRDDYIQLRRLARGRSEFEVPGPRVCGVDPTPDSLGCEAVCTP